MHDAFVPLAQFLQPPDVHVAAVEEPLIVVSESVERSELHAALSEVRRFRAALADALDASVHDLLCDIAADVVARELRLRPAELRAIVLRARERFAAEEPVALRAHPDDCNDLCDGDVAVVPDPALRRGDVMLDVRSGTIDATLGARLESVLESLRHR